MRRDQVLKICMNHALTSEIIYKPKDEKSWLFVVNDFSEGELNLEHFCLRFKSVEIAAEFKKAIDEALKGLPAKNGQKDVKLEKKESDDSDDVVFVSEIQATSEEKQKAKELMLPENFFTYKNKPPCLGCRGCSNSDDSNTSSSDSKSDSNTTLTNEPNLASPALEIKPSTTANLKASTASNATPVKTTTPLFLSPTNSVYGTPSNLEKTVDTSIFRTPLGSIGSNSKTPVASDQNNFGINKENTFIQRPNIFPGFGEQSVKLETQNKTTSLVGSGDSQTATSLNNSILRQPKLNILNPSNKDQNENSTFRTVPPKYVFSDTKLNIGNSNTGLSTNKSIFEFSKDNKTDAPNTEVKSIFGDDNKLENLFTSVNQGSIFGPGALSNTQSKFGTGTFGSAFGSISQNPVFDAGKSLFSNAASAFGENTDKEQQKVMSTVLTASGDHKPEEKKLERIEPVLNADNNLTFAALSSSSGAAFNTMQSELIFKVFTIVL